MRFAFLGLCLASCIIPMQQPVQQGGGGAPTAYNGGQSSGDPYAASPSAAPGGETSAAPPAGPIYVDIKSRYPQTVKVFYGARPKWGSGTYSTIESNSIEGHTFNPGEQMWIVDESENGIAQAQVGPGMHEIEVGESCTSLVAR